MHLMQLSGHLPNLPLSYFQLFGDLFLAPPTPRRLGFHIMHLFFLKKDGLFL
uniref:Uncharacterized protein n=1 Tax=Anguilla anguilla TaxID=7936 RepID=A0A0E9V6E0_ANGAN